MHLAQHAVISLLLLAWRYSRVEDIHQFPIGFTGYGEIAFSKPPS